MANALVNIDLLVPSYGAISEIPETGTGPPHTPGSLTHIYCYKDYVISAVQGVPDCQHQVLDGAVRALKRLLLSLPGELKDSVSVKKLVAGEGGWNCVKEFLMWILDMESGTVTISEKNLKDLLTLADIPANQRRMGRKDLERLVAKLRSMHLAVPGVMANLFHIQHALNQGGVDRAWICPAFHRKSHRLEGACPKSGVQADAPGGNFPLVNHPSGLGAGGVWLDLSSTAHNLVWRYPLPQEIIADLVLLTNPQGMIINSDFELASLVL